MVYLKQNIENAFFRLFINRKMLFVAFLISYILLLVVDLLCYQLLINVVHGMMEKNRSVTQTFIPKAGSGQFISCEKINYLFNKAHESGTVTIKNGPATISNNVEAQPVIQYSRATPALFDTSKLSFLERAYVKVGTKCTGISACGEMEGIIYTPLKGDE
jgi:hypothetical protein